MRTKRIVPTDSYMKAALEFANECRASIGKAPRLTLSTGVRLTIDSDPLTRTVGDGRTDAHQWMLVTVLEDKDGARPYISRVIHHYTTDEVELFIRLFDEGRYPQLSVKE